MDKEDNAPEEEKDMSVLEKNLKLNNNLWKKAEKNTKRNSDGLTTTSRDCPYREEFQWEKSIKKTK